MNIFQKIIKSIYGPEYYSQIIKEKPFSYSVKYYLLFALIFAVIFAVVITLKFIPIAGMISQKSSRLSDYFPQKLEINIKDGKASSNMTEPYFLKLPKSFKASVGGNETELQNAVVIDTKDKFDVNSFNSFKALAVLNSDSIAYINNNQIAINSLSGVKDFTLNRDKIIECINRIKPYLVFLYPIVFVGTYFGGFMMVIAYLICLLLEALLVWLVAKVKGIKLGYRKSYQVSMHLMTAPFIICSLMLLAPVKIPFLFTGLLVISAILNLRREESAV